MASRRKKTSGGASTVLTVMQSCERLSARLPVTTCITRWKRSGSAGATFRTAPGQIQQPVYEACKGCMVGRANARRAEADELAREATEQRA
jgi:hypothetical protein